MDSKPFVFSVSDKYTPDEYVNNIVVPQVEEMTQGLLYSKISKYEGMIYSYDTLGLGGMRNMIKNLGGETQHHNIQDELGCQVPFFWSRQT